MSQQPAPRTILIADPDPGVCAALQLVMAQRLNIPDAVTVPSIVALLAQLPVRRPSLVLVEWRLLSPAPAHTLRMVRATCPQATVLVLSVDPTDRVAALAAGADVFLSKTELPERVVLILEQAEHAPDEESKEASDVHEPGRATD